jgi:hypothetical protein
MDRERFFFFGRPRPEAGRFPLAGRKNERTAEDFTDSGLTFTVFCVKVRRGSK